MEGSEDDAAHQKAVIKTLFENWTPEVQTELVPTADVLGRVLARDYEACHQCPRSSCGHVLRHGLVHPPHMEIWRMMDMENTSDGYRVRQKPGKGV